MLEVFRTLDSAQLAVRLAERIEAVHNVGGDLGPEQLLYLLGHLRGVGGCSQRLLLPLCDTRHTVPITTAVPTPNLSSGGLHSLCTVADRLFGLGRDR